MIAVLQRVSKASVSVDGQIVGAISRGLLVLVGVEQGDTEQDAEKLVEKVVSLRIFEDSEGKMNLDVKETGGALLVISQFTLLGDTRKGRRPSFDRAARPERAKIMYTHFVKYAKQKDIVVSTGVFQAHMDVSLTNDGPVTLICTTRSGQIPPNNSEAAC